MRTMQTQNGATAIASVLYVGTILYVGRISISIRFLPVSRISSLLVSIHELRYQECGIPIEEANAYRALALACLSYRSHKIWEA